MNGIIKFPENAKIRKILAENFLKSEISWTGACLGPDDDPRDLLSVQGD